MKIVVILLALSMVLLAGCTSTVSRVEAEDHCHNIYSDDFGMYGFDDFRVYIGEDGFTCKAEISDESYYKWKDRQELLDRMREICRDCR